MLPNRLTPGDEIRVIAPSTSMALVKGKQVEFAIERLTQLGFRLHLGKMSRTTTNSLVHRLTRELRIYTKLFKIQM